MWAANGAVIASVGVSRQSFFSLSVFRSLFSIVHRFSRRAAAIALRGWNSPLSTWRTKRLPAHPDRRPVRRHVADARTLSVQARLVARLQRIVCLSHPAFPIAGEIIISFIAHWNSITINNNRGSWAGSVQCKSSMNTRASPRIRAAEAAAVCLCVDLFYG